MFPGIEEETKRKIENSEALDAEFLNKSIQDEVYRFVAKLEEKVSPSI